MSKSGCLVKRSSYLMSVLREMKKGFLKSTNVTSSIATPTQREVTAKTVIRIRGDPGYLSTAGIAILLNH